MKTFSITTIFLTATLASSVSAFRPSQNWEFTRAELGFVGGSILSTKCSGEDTNEYTNIQSADQCTSTCSNAAVNSASSFGPSLVGYNYNCHTKKCDCILGRKSDNFSSTVKKAFSGNWACYEANSFSPPTPTPPTSPTPARCTLPATVGGKNGKKVIPLNVNKLTGAPPVMLVTASFQADNTQDCANQCTARNLPSDAPGSMQMIGFDYSCDTKQCTCLTASGCTNLKDTVQFTNENMACYFVSGNSVGDEAYAQMETKKYLRAD